jgi:hypothetical protein
LADGRFTDAQHAAEASASLVNYFAPISLPLAARAALWNADARGATALVERLESSVVRGQAVGLDKVTLRAGLAALEGRRADAVAGYREASRGWRQLGLAFDEAMAALDLAIVLAPTEREMSEAAATIDGAHETLTRLGALPLLARLEATRTRPAPAGHEPPIDAPVAGSSEVRA